MGKLVFPGEWIIYPYDSYSCRREALLWRKSRLPESQLWALSFDPPETSLKFYFQNKFVGFKVNTSLSYFFFRLAGNKHWFPGIQFLKLSIFGVVISKQCSATADFSVVPLLSFQFFISCDHNTAFFISYNESCRCLIFRVSVFPSSVSIWCFTFLRNPKNK